MLNIIYVYCPVYGCLLGCLGYCRQSDCQEFEETPPGMRGKHKKNDKYDVGVPEVLQFIGCYSPQAYNEILKCGITFLNARKYVRKLINQTAKYTEYDCCNHPYPFFISQQPGQAEYIFFDGH